MEGNPVYGAGPQPPTAATGGGGVAELENQACNLPPDLQVAPGTQPPTATTVGEDRQEKKNEEREPDDWQCFSFISYFTSTKIVSFIVLVIFDLRN